MKTKIIISFAFATVICFLSFGCANTSLVQAKLTASEAKVDDLQSRLELSEGRVQELRAEASKNDELCQKAMAKLNQIEHTASELYTTEKPVVIRLATEAYDAAKPVVEQKANEAYNWATETIKAQLQQPDPSTKPSKK
jgi:predicted nuclease with TOPRIM domain